MDKEIFSKLFAPNLEVASQVWSLLLEKHKELGVKIPRKETKMVANTES